MEPEIALRLRVLAPPAGAHFALQEGSAALKPATRAGAEGLQFDFTLRLAAEGPASPARLLGRFAQGPPSARFVYLNSGGYAGEGAGRWSRRAKVPLKGINRALAQAALAAPGAWLEASIAGTARDGGPCCASVALLDGWRLAGPDPGAP
jgi:hypothetical protein